MTQSSSGTWPVSAMGVGRASAGTPTSKGHDYVEVGEAHALFEASYALIGRAVAFACRRYRFDRDDEEEFRGIVHLKLVENDYAVLRAYEGRSGLSTYLSIVIQRWALDYRIHAWGKWHPSAEAKRLGPLAVELEQLLLRDGRTLEETVPVLGAKHGGVTLDALRKLAAQLPQRAPKRHDVPVEEADPIAGPHEIEDHARIGERRRTAGRIATLLREAIARRPEDLRVILQMRFVHGMTVAQIARALQRDQKLLYRLLDRCMHEIQEELAAAGIAAGDALDLVGRDDVFLAFDFGISNARPSKASDERVAAPTEGLE